MTFIDGIIEWMYIFKLTYRMKRLMQVSRGLAGEEFSNKAMIRNTQKGEKGGHICALT